MKRLYVGIFLLSILHVFSFSTFAKSKGENDGAKTSLVGQVCDAVIAALSKARDTHLPPELLALSLEKSRAGKESPLAVNPIGAIDPFYPEGRYDDRSNDLTNKLTAEGAPIVVVGRILDRQGNPIPNAEVQIWQTDSHGQYDDPQDPQRGKNPLDPKFGYFGRTITNANGEYRFRTNKPDWYAVIEGVWERPDHIHFAVVIKGKAYMSTQMYFEGDRRIDDDDLHQSLTPSQKRASTVRFEKRPYQWDPNEPTLETEMGLFDIVIDPNRPIKIFKGNLILIQNKARVARGLRPVKIPLTRTQKIVRALRIGAATIAAIGLPSFYFSGTPVVSTLEKISGARTVLEAKKAELSFSNVNAYTPNSSEMYRDNIATQYTPLREYPTKTEQDKDSHWSASFDAGKGIITVRSRDSNTAYQLNNSDIPNIHNLRVIPNRNSLIYSTYENIVLWNFVTNKKEVLFDLKNKNQLDVSADGKLIAVFVPEKNTLIVRDLSSGQNTNYAFSSSTNAENSKIEFSSDSKKVLVIANNNHMMVVDLSNQTKTIRDYPDLQPDSVEAHFNSDGSKIIVAIQNYESGKNGKYFGKILEVLDSKSFEVVDTLRGAQESTNLRMHGAISIDVLGDLVVIATFESSLIFKDLKSGDVRKVNIDVHDRLRTDVRIKDVRFLNSRWVLVFGSDYSTLLYDIQKNEFVDISYAARIGFWPEKERLQLLKDGVLHILDLSTLTEVPK